MLNFGIRRTPGDPILLESPSCCSYHRLVYGVGCVGRAQSGARILLFGEADPFALSRRIVPPVFVAAPGRGCLAGANRARAWHSRLKDAASRPGRVRDSERKAFRPKVVHLRPALQLEVPLDKHDATESPEVS